LDAQTLKKVHVCQAQLTKVGRVVVAFSGGVDSTFLLALAAATLGEKNVLAVTNVSAIHPQMDSDQARCMAEHIGVEMIEVMGKEMDRHAFRANPPDRCYHCKRIVMAQLREAIRPRGFEYLVEGGNADDLNDWRPGRKALAEQGIPSPMVMAGLTKARIREFSRELGLPTWSQPASPCLASRIPFGVPVTREALVRVALVEEALGEMKLTACRARAHGDLLRLELSVEQMPPVLQHREEINAAAQKAGFRWVTLDLEGYRPSRP
jgi:uncharacterized protein